MSNSLPTSLTSLLGREQEIATLRQLLKGTEVRLVTITGPGGVGKTSLALQVAHELRDPFKDGVFFISLAPISDSTLIIPTIAQALGATESPNRLLLDSLKDFLRNKQVLLLLDNFEQILSAAPLLTELLNACAELRMLVTSREALHLRGEHEFPLEPLKLDDHAIKPDDRSANTLMQSPAVALFTQRVQAVQPDFVLTEENASAVTEICAHLDGLPLAIELAAARIKLLPPKAMLEKLQASPLQLLTSGTRDMPARQQTLRNAIQWSYDLLEANETYTFRWLAAFVGGCTLEAAQSVIGAPASLDVLESLVGKSLVRQTEMDGAPRLTMLETIREFGLEQLSDARELESARRVHATYYLTFAEDAERELTGANQKNWLQRLEREQDNLRAALSWAIKDRDVEFAQRMAGALQPFWLTRGYWSEGRRWLEESLALDTGAALSPAVRAKTLYGAGLLARFQGDFARARMLLEASLASYRALAENTGVLMALVELSRITAFQDDRTAKKVFLAEATSLLETLPDTVVKAYAYSELATAMVSYGRDAIQFSPEAAPYLDESVRINRALNNPSGLALALIRQASGSLFTGDFTLMASQLDEVERLSLELGDERILSRLTGMRVLFDLQKGDFATARHRLENSIRQIANLGDHQQVSYSLLLFAAVLHGQGLDVWSARILGLVEGSTGTHETPGEEMVSTFITRFSGIGDIRAEVRAQLGDEAFVREIAAGKRLKLDDLQTIPHPPEPVSAAQVPPSSATGASLTTRETEVLRLLAQDLSNPQIAERLVVSRRTVDAHLRSIYDKLGVKSRDAAIRVAMEHGLISSL
jgi:predicted ATPase/DNA-binding CsgD family transcriptional regulator